MLPTAVVDEVTAFQFIRDVIDELGGGFFPKYSFGDYLTLLTREPTYTPIESTKRDRLLLQTRKILGDQFDVVVAGAIADYFVQAADSEMETEMLSTRFMSATFGKETTAGQLAGAAIPH